MPILEEAPERHEIVTTGRSPYSPPVNPGHRVFPLISPYSLDRVPALTPEQQAMVDDMFAEADERRGRVLNVEEIERSISLCRRCGVRVPQWMLIALRYQQDERARKYPQRAKSPEA